MCMDLFGSLLGFCLSLPVGNDHRAGSIAHDVQGGTTHVEDLVDTNDQTDARNIASMIMPAPETPAVPMDARVAVMMMDAICASVRSTL